MYSLFARLLPTSFPIERWLFGGFWLFSFAGCLGAGLFYLVPITLSTAIFWGLCVLLVGAGLSFVPHAPEPFRQQDTKTIAPWIFCVAIALAAIAIHYTIYTLHITDGIRSFWPLVPPWIFVCAALMFFLILSLTWRHTNRFAPPVIGWIIGLGGVLLTALLAYPIGYGFDGFIHRATESYIIDHGAISPKPPYYSGQYGLFSLLSLITRLPITLIDTWFVPLVAALLTPLCVFVLSKRLFPKEASIGLISLVFLPLTSWIATTPQGFANLWVLLTSLLFTWAFHQRLSTKTQFVLFSAPILFTLSIHPIAGIPLLGMAVVLFLSSSSAPSFFGLSRRFLMWGVSIGATLALPALFLLRAFLEHGHITLPTLSAAYTLFKEDWLVWVNAWQSFEHPILHTDSLLHLLLMGIVVLLGVVGYTYLGTTSSFRKAYPLMMGILLGTYISLILLVDFSFLISYETRSYADRLLTILMYELFPLVVVGVGFLATRVRLLPTPMRVSIGVLLSLALVSQWFHAYPRNDAYVRSGGLNVSTADLQAVRFIQNIKSPSYLVLSNQNTSAAALKELGFFHYYGDVFAYPIPTGGELYTMFLSMNETPSREIASLASELANTACQKAACDLLPVQDVFFVVPDWWWQSGKIIETAKTTADSWWAIEGGLTIFRYQAPF